MGINCGAGSRRRKGASYDDKRRDIFRSSTTWSFGGVCGKPLDNDGTIASSRGNRKFQCGWGNTYLLLKREFEGNGVDCHGVCFFVQERSTSLTENYCYGAYRL